jgi:hypothetical protein
MYLAHLGYRCILARFTGSDADSTGCRIIGVLLIAAIGEPVRRFRLKHPEIRRVLVEV